MSHSAASVDLRLEATANNVTVARQTLGGVADALGWDDAFAGDVRLALSEACTNVVMHAYRNANAPGQMLINVVIEAGKVVVAVTDTGRGMTAQGPDVGLGLGLALMRSLADELEIRSHEGATSVRMSFTPPSAAQRDE